MRLCNRERVDTTDFASSSATPVREDLREGLSFFRVLVKFLFVLGGPRLGTTGPNPSSSSSSSFLTFCFELLAVPVGVLWLFRDELDDPDLEDLIDLDGVAGAKVLPSNEKSTSRVDLLGDLIGFSLPTLSPNKSRLDPLARDDIRVDLLGDLIGLSLPTLSPNKSRLDPLARDDIRADLLGDLIGLSLSTLSPNKSRLDPLARDDIRVDLLGDLLGLSLSTLSSNESRPAPLARNDIRRTRPPCCIECERRTSRVPDLPELVIATEATALVSTVEAAATAELLVLLRLVILLPELGF
jgi:hypothetical protein